jgi:hypothetical protein
MIPSRLILDHCTPASAGFAVTTNRCRWSFRALSNDWDGPEGRPNNVAAGILPPVRPLQPTRAALEARNPTTAVVAKMPASVRASELEIGHYKFAAANVCDMNQSNPDF